MKELELEIHTLNNTLKKAKNINPTVGKLEKSIELLRFTKEAT